MSVLILIDKENLINLYENEKLNTYEIASLFNCCQATIWKRLHAFGIKPRVPGNPTDITKEMLEDFYINKKLSTWQIERIYKYSRGTVYRKLKEYNIETRNIAESHILYPRFNFSGDKIEKAYIIGFAMGDLRVRKCGSKSETIKVGCASTKNDQIKLISKVFDRYGKVWISKPGKRGIVNMECSLNNSFGFLLKKRTLPDNWILKNKKCFASFIAGFSDAEGCLSISKGKGYYSLGNYNKSLLRRIRYFLMMNNIICSKLHESKTKGRLCFGKYFHNQNYWQFCITRKQSLLYFFGLIGIHLRHKAKIKAMKIVKKNIYTRNKKFGYLKMN